MDVRLPDGTIIKGVPEGTTKADLMARLGANGYDVAKLEASSGGPAPTAQADDPGVMRAALIGAGRATDQIAKGAQQLYYRATGNQAAQDELAARVQEENRLYAPLQKQHPIATSLGEAAPDATMLAGGGGLLSLLARGAVAGAAPAALKYGTDGERLGRAASGALGGAVGAGAGVAAVRTLRPIMAGTGASSTVLDAATRLGFQPTPAQLTNNAALANFENYLSKSPGSSGAIAKVRDAQQAALNSAGARAMGETADNLGESVFAGAQNRIGSEFRRLEGVTSPDLANSGFMNALAQVDSANLARGPFKDSEIGSLVDKGLELASQNKLSGEAYKQIRTTLNNAENSAFKGGNADLGQAYKSVKEALDGAAEGSLSAADQQAWKQARAEWRAFKTLSKSNVAEAGNVSPARVAAELRRQGPGLRTGAAQGELADIARIGEGFKAPPNQNSGNLLHTAIYGNPITALPAAGTNKLLSLAYLSKPGRAYLTNGLVPIGQGTQNATGRLGAVAGSPLLQALLGVE